MTLKDLIERAMADRAAKVAAHNALADELGALRSAETPDEVVISETRAAKNAVADEVDVITERIAELEAELRTDEAMGRLATESAPAARKPAYDGVARVGQETRTYRPDHDRDGSVFLRDLGASVLGDFGAQQRLNQHMAEERVERSEYLDRAVATSAFAGLVVPQYLTDLYAPATAALRPFADVCTSHPLPADGMTVNISRITTASSVALQTENAAVSETNMDDTLLTVSIQTAAGQQTISRQAIDRGTGVDGVVLADLFARYATTLDSTLINQAATGLTNVAQNVAYTDLSPTAAELYPKVLNAQANVEAALLGFGYADYAVMHSRRWAWMQSQVSSTWPFIGQPGIAAEHGGTSNAGGYASGVRGILPNGMKVIVDNNISTALGAGTEDEIYVVPSNECHLWEDANAPMFIRAEQPAAASLGVLFVVYGYFAYTFGRYTNGTSKISGTGLIAPTF